MATVAQLGARALRKLGVAVVADASRPSAAPTTTADAVAQLALRELGVVIPEALRATTFATVTQAELGYRTLRVLGVNPVADGSASAHTTIYTTIEVADRALRAVGINPGQFPGVSESSGAVYGAAQIGQAALIKLGIYAAGDTISASYATDLVEAQAKVASVHEIMAMADIATWLISAVPAWAFEYYVTMTAHFLAPEFGKTADLASYQAVVEMMRILSLSGSAGRALAQAKATAVHESLAAQNLITWDTNSVPAAVVEDYVLMTGALLEAIYVTAAEKVAYTSAQNKQIDSGAYVAAEARIRMIALSGAAGQALAMAKISAVHDALTAAGLTSWNVASVPQPYSEEYVTMAAVLLAPVYGKPGDMALYTAAEGRVRAGGIIAGAQARAVAQVQSVHEELNALGLVTWTSDTIPASVADAYQEMTVQTIGPQLGKELDPKAYALAMHRIKLVAMGGPAGQALAVQKIQAVHYDLDARGWTRWQIFSIPDYVEEAYVCLAATLLAPEVETKADPNWAIWAEMALARYIAVPDEGTVSVCYY